MTQASIHHVFSQRGAVARRQTWIGMLDALLGARTLDPRRALALCDVIGREEPGALPAHQLAHLRGTLQQLQSRIDSQILGHAARRELKMLQATLCQSRRVPFGKLDPNRPDAAERKLLGLSTSGPLSSTDINAAFRAAAVGAHPDNGGTTERFTALVAARDVLLRSAE